MKINDLVRDGVVVIALEGKINSPDHRTLLHGRVKEYLESDHLNIVLDFDKVEWVNSLGIGTIFAASASVDSKEGRLVLSNITNIKALQVMRKFLQMFDVYDDTDEAVKSFKQPSTEG